MNKLMNKLEIWICAVAKMEELYIREWIIWNKKIGITELSSERYNIFSVVYE